MVQYRFAKNTSDEIADANLLVGKDLAGIEFFCLGCDQRLLPKVNGTVLSPHFAHRQGASCSPETYLHRLGKEVFAEVYTKCLETGDPFEIELSHPLVCRRFEGFVGSACVMKDRRHIKTHDLTPLYNQVQIEKRDGQFIPDLLLTSDAAPSRRIYVEIAVTHFLSKKKEHSGEKVIEIPLESEDDLERIRSRKLTPRTARFVNFATESQSLVDADCTCASLPGYAFIVYDSGKCVLDKSTIDGLASKRQKNSNCIKYFRILDNHRLSTQEGLPPPGPTFRQAVVQAHKDGFAFRNCYLCKYQGDNYAGDPERPVFCKTHKKACGSNEAVNCDRYRLSEWLSNCTISQGR